MSVYIPTPTLFLRTDKKKKNGKMPLFIRFQRIDGKEPKFSFGKKAKRLSSPKKNGMIRINAPMIEN